MGQIESVEEGEKRKKRIMIKNLDSGQLVEVMGERVRPYQAIGMNQIAVDMPVRAIFAGDGLLYDAVVKKVGKNKVSIVFTEYGDQADVPLNDIVLTTDSKKHAKQLAGQQKTGLIPDYLKPKDTDSEEVAASKRRRVKAMKNNNRQDRLESELNTRANKWQQFAKKSKPNSSKRPDADEISTLSHSAAALKSALKKNTDEVETTDF